MRLDESTLALPVARGAGALTSGLLREADLAAQRLAVGADHEALHDFRVALRRLRSTLRAFRPWLEGVKRRQVRRLGRIAGSTNPARDAEVQLAWLEGQRRGLASPSHRAGHALLVERISPRAADEVATRRAVARYRRVSKKLAGGLAQEVDGGGEAPPFGAVLAKLLLDELARLTRRVAAIGGPEDEVGAHRARIQSKRLRYLLEPLKGSLVADASGAIRSLKVLQTLLGELHDAHVLGRELDDALEEQPAAPGGPRSGVLELARRLERHRDALHAQVGQRWRAGERRHRLEREVKSVAATLGARSARGAPRR